MWAGYWRLAQKYLKFDPMIYWWPQSEMCEKVSITSKNSSNRHIYYLYASIISPRIGLNISNCILKKEGCDDKICSTIRTNDSYTSKEKQVWCCMQIRFHDVKLFGRCSIRPERYCILEKSWETMGSLLLWFMVSLLLRVGCMVHSLRFLLQP